MGFKGAFEKSEILVKKIDLHIHTVPTISDSHFTFSLDAFREYVQAAKLDAVAITNHNVFHADQFREIEAALGIVVFPGIEVDVGNGHVLIMSSASDLDDFDGKAAQVSKRITKPGESMSIEELKKIYGDLRKV